jgi:hypothetical protein
MPMTLMEPHTDDPYATIVSHYEASPLDQGGALAVPAGGGEDGGTEAVRRARP